MGYNTIFEGELKFKKELRASEIAHLEKNFGERIEYKSGNDSYFDIVFNEDYTGIKWDDRTEKTYYMEEIIQHVIDMGYELEGVLKAQGEEHDDRWELHIKDGQAVRIECPRIGQKVECPHCGETFNLETEDE